MMTGVYTGLATMAGIAAVAATNLPGPPPLEGWERLGAPALALALMAYFLQREMRERERLTARSEGVQEELLEILRSNSKAIESNAQANLAVAEAIREMGDG